MVDFAMVDFAPELYEWKKDRNSILLFVSSIVHKDRRYEFRYPLLCTMDTIDDGIIIENPMLGIYVQGCNPDEAENMFSEEFDYIFNRYNELPDKKLTDDIRTIKDFLNHILKK